MIDVNLKAVFFLSQAFARAAFARQAGGAIVNIASLLAFQGGIRIPSYTAAKHGVAGLTKLLANEWAARGINVNAIAPGYIETNNTEALRADPDRSKAILDRIPAGRWGEPSDIAGAAVFLASPAAATSTAPSSPSTEAGLPADPLRRDGRADHPTLAPTSATLALLHQETWRAVPGVRGRRAPRRRGRTRPRPARNSARTCAHLMAANGRPAHAATRRPAVPADPPA